MQRIQLYQFSLESQAPTKTHLLHEWFKDQVSKRSIEPIDVLEVTHQGPVNGKPENRPFAIHIFRVMLSLKKSFKRFKKRW